MKELDLEMYVNSLQEGDNITVTCDLLSAMEEALDEIKWLRAEFKEYMFKEQRKY